MSNDTYKQTIQYFHERCEALQNKIVELETENKQLRNEQ
jgi:hypothetical protein